MGHFHAIPDAVAVSANRLVAVVRVGSDGAVVVRDLASGGLSTISASELCAPPALSDPAVAPVLALVQATDAQWELARHRSSVIAELVNASDLSGQVTRVSVRAPWAAPAGASFDCIDGTSDAQTSATHPARMGIKTGFANRGAVFVLSSLGW